MIVPEFIVSVDLGQLADPTAICVLERREQPTGRHEVVANVGAWFAGGEDLPRYSRRQQTAGFYDVVHLERLELGMSYVEIPNRLRTLERRLQERWVEAMWREYQALAALADAPIELVIDQTGVGRPVVDLLVEHGVDPVCITITGGDQVVRVSERELRVPKREVVSAVNAAMQARRVQAAAALADWPVLKAELSNFKAKIALSGHDSYEAGPAESWREGAHDDLVLALALGVWDQAARRRRWRRRLCRSRGRQPRPWCFRWHRTRLAAARGAAGVHRRQRESGGVAHPARRGTLSGQRDRSRLAAVRGGHCRR